MLNNSTPYGNGQTSGWSLTGYNSITLDQNNIANIIGNASNNYLLLAVVDYAYDYLKVGPPGVNNIGIWFSDSQAGKRPYLDITTGHESTGISVNTVLFADIGKVNTVASASIGKINTVD